MCQTEGTPLGDASNKGLGPKMQNHQLSWWIFIFRNILDRVKACYAFTGQFSVNLLKRKKLSRRKHVMLLLDNLVEIY